MTLSPLEESLLREHFGTEEAYASALKRLETGEPFAYVIGEWYFMNETYLLNEDCLIPRPDTEHVVEYLITHAPKNAQFLDLCTGSGCIAISTLVRRPDLLASAVEISPGAREMAVTNAKRNGVANRFTALLGDVLMGEGPRGPFEVIVSNPPYIRSGVIPTLSEQVRREPRIALDGGEDGLIFYRAILEHYTSCLTEDGFFVFEIGYDQADDLRRLAQDHGMQSEIRKDYGGNDRVAILKRI